VSANTSISNIPRELTDQIFHILTQDATLSSCYAGMLGSIHPENFQSIFKDHIKLYSRDLISIARDEVERRVSKVIARNAQRYAYDVVDLYDRQTATQSEPGTRDAEERIKKIDGILSKLPAKEGVEDDVKITYDKLEDFLIRGHPFHRLQERFRHSRDYAAEGPHGVFQPPSIHHKEDVEPIAHTADRSQTAVMPTPSPHRPTTQESEPHELESQDFELQNMDNITLHSKEVPLPKKLAISDDMLEIDLESQESNVKSPESLPAGITQSQSTRRLRWILRKLHLIKSEEPIEAGMVRLRWQIVSPTCQIRHRTSNNDRRLLVDIFTLMSAKTAI
jgi:hypothetical protein